MHFTRMAGYRDTEVPIIVRGDGCYLEDASGKRYLDALAGLFSVNLGYSFGEEMGQAALDQMRELPFYTNWTYAHPRAIELASEVASLAPGDLNRVFFTPTGGDAVETAIKMARQYWKLRGQHGKTKVISRYLAYHGTSLGALALTGVPSIKTPFEPLMPGAIKVQTPYRYRCNDCMNQGACTLRCAAISAATSPRRAPWSRPTACASTSAIPRR